MPSPTVATSTAKRSWRARKQASRHATKADDLELKGGRALAVVQRKWSDIQMRPSVIGMLFAIMMLSLSCGAGSAQTLPRVGETWQLKMDGFGCAKNDDLDRLLHLLHHGDQTGFSMLLLRFRGEVLCQDLPKATAFARRLYRG
jgi:hypothetical protein